MVLVLATLSTPVSRLDRLGVVGREDPPLGAFEGLVARREEERHLPVPAVQDQVRMRGLDPAQVVELVGLAREDEAARLGHPLDDGDAPLPHPVEDRRPAGPEFLGGKSD